MVGDARRRFNVRFYLVAIMFVAFDVEIVVLYPWAASFARMLQIDPALGQVGPPQGQPPSTAGMVIKGKAPVSNAVLAVKLPHPQEATLANGLRVMVLEDHRLPRVSFQLMIPGAGGYYDPAAKIGLSGMTAQMMREGTTTKSSQAISQALETMAANLNVGSGASQTMATMSGGSLTENLPGLFDLAGDVLLNPSFAADEWDRIIGDLYEHDFSKARERLSTWEARWGESAQTRNLRHQLDAMPRGRGD